MDDKKNPKNINNSDNPKNEEDNFEENEKFPNQNFDEKVNQLPKNLIPKKYTSQSSTKNTDSEASDLLKVAEGFREEIQETRSYLRRFDKDYEENVKKDPIYHHLSQMSDLTIEDDELAQRIYKNKIKEYKGMREGPTQNRRYGRAWEESLFKSFWTRRRRRTRAKEAKYRTRCSLSTKKNDITKSNSCFRRYL